MRNFFEPGDGPSWLRMTLSSIRAALGDIWPSPLRLAQYTTAKRPLATDTPLGGMIFDTTDNRPAFSTASTWVELMPYTAGAALTKTDDTNVTVTLGGTPATALLQAVSLTVGWSGTLSVARGGTGGGSASGTLLDNITGFASTGQIVRTGAGAYAFRTLTAPAAGIAVNNGDGVAGNPTLALANDLAALEALSGTSTIYYRSGVDTWTAVTIGGLLSFSAGTLNIGTTTGTGSTLVLSAGPTLTGTTNVAALTASGLVLSTVAAGGANLQANQTTGTVLNNGTFDFPAAQNYGMFLINETVATGAVALCVFSAIDGAVIGIVWQSAGNFFSATAGTAGKVSLYFSGGKVRIENKLSVSATFGILNLKGSS